MTGNFHITPGKSLIVPGGHVHLTGPFFGSGATNFSHRINQFSFGVLIKGIIYPLEGQLCIANESKDMNFIHKMCSVKAGQVALARL